MNKLRNLVLSLLYFSTTSVMGLFVGAMLFGSPTFAQTAIVVTVNGNAITNYDIQRRIALLKLQKKTGDLALQAKNELIDEILTNTEVKRRNIKILDKEVDSAFENFAKQNGITAEQFAEILTQTDVTVEHFKAYIHRQIGWGRLVNARYQAESGVFLTEQEVAHRMLKSGGIKPSTNEYTLQRVIFVIPEHRRSQILERRHEEANNFRANFKGCDNTKKQAKGILDVTIRNFGKILEPQIPQNWEEAVRETPAGKMTRPQETEYGIEMLAICQIRRVSDDRVAQLLFSMEEIKKATPQKLQSLGEKYLQELRQEASIQNS